MFFCRLAKPEGEVGRGMGKLKELLADLEMLVLPSPEAIVESADGSAAIARDINVSGVAARLPPKECIAFILPERYLTGKKLQAFTHQQDLPV